MMKLNIDLAEKQEFGPNPVTKSQESPEVYYPEFSFSESEPPEFPDEGKMTVVYKKIRSSVDEKAPKGKRYRCTLEVHKILSAESAKEEADADAPSKRDRRSEEALDALMRKRNKKEEDESEDY